MDPEDIQLERELCKLGEFDLTDPRVFKKVAGVIKQGRIRWLHLAPPCSTFSRARRDGLRSGAPWGSKARRAMKDKLREADELARNTFILALLQVRAGGYVSIENPEHSLLWKLDATTNFLRLPGVHDICGDQCCSGGL